MPFLGLRRLLGVCVLTDGWNQEPTSLSKMPEISPSHTTFSIACIPYSTSYLVQ